MSMFEVEEIEMFPKKQEFLGKFRATVVNNIDPENRGRIQATVSDVSTFSVTSWALPCMPWGGIQTGVFAVPMIGAGVWIEFEQGDPDYPIWTGCYWGSAAETPAGSKMVPPAIPGITIQTPTNNMIQVSDVPGPTGGIQLKTRTGAMISITDIGITISNGMGASITLTGPTVDINSGALTVV